MILRRLSVILAVVVLAAGFGINKLLSAQKEPPPRNQLAREPAKVTVRTVHNGPVRPEIPITGRLVATDRVPVFAEVSGRVLPGAKPFREGMAFARGETLFRLDDTDQRLNLVARRAAFQSQLLRLVPELRFDYPEDAGTWAAYAADIDPQATLDALPEGGSEGALNYLRVQGIPAEFYGIRAAEAQLAKFSVHAPFSGVVTSGDLDPGTLVRAGVQVGAFLNPGGYELEASVSAEDWPLVRVGQAVSLEDRESGRRIEGRITRAADAIDPATQTIKVYAAVTGEGFFEGQYLSGHVRAEAIPDAVTLARALVREDGHVWVVRDSALALQAVTAVFGFGERVAVRGLDDGTALVDQRLGGPFEGMPVRPVAAEPVAYE